MVAALALAVAAPMQPLASVVHLPTTLLVRWVTSVARTCASTPFTVDGRAAAGLAGVVALAAAAVALARAGGSLRRDGRHRARGTVPDAAPR
jgi:hypothetical protein